MQRPSPIEKVKALFTEAVTVVIADEQMMRAPLWPEEKLMIGNAALKRRLEYTGGRAAARKALSLLGAEDTPLVSNSAGVPEWPRGYVGSISHCDGFCGAVVARQSRILSLGFDAESSAPLPRNLYDLIFGEYEANRCAMLPLLRHSNWGKILFSAKEAYYKSYFPIAGQFLDFLDVRITLAVNTECSGSFHPTAASADGYGILRESNRFSGNWCVDETHVFCGATFY